MSILSDLDYTEPTVKLEALSEAQLRALLGWDPDLSGADNAKQLLLAAARNRRMPEDIPASLITEAA